MLTACEVIQKPKIERNTVHLQFPQNSQTGVIKQVNYSQKKVKKKSCCSTVNTIINPSFSETSQSEQKGQVSQH